MRSLQVKPKCSAGNNEEIVKMKVRCKNSRRLNRLGKGGSQKRVKLECKKGEVQGEDEGDFK